MAQRAREVRVRVLRGARIGISAADYEWRVFVGGVAGALGGFSIAFGLLTFAHVPLVSVLAISAGSGMAGLLLTRLAFLLYPLMRAGSRASRIEAEFPDVSILCYALAKGGLQALEILRTVRDEKETYGEISEEFGVIVRDVEWFGQDLNSALESAAMTTASPRLRSFFSGLVAILNSGADPRDYFRRQAEAQLETMDTRVEKELEQSGLLAESYVSGLLVLPLLLMIVISVMSVFTGGRTMVLKSIVFLFVPIGTLAYGVLLDTLLPSASLGAPPRRDPDTSDFGMEVVVADGARMRYRMGDRADDKFVTSSAAMSGAGAWLRVAGSWLAATWRRLVTRARSRPVDAFLVSFPLAALVGGLGALGLWRAALTGESLHLAINTLVVVVGIIAIVPVAIFHEMRTGYVRQIERALPETIGKLSGFNDRGISILQAFKIVGQTVDGPLAKELKAFDRDVKWNFNFGAALMRMRRRVLTPRVTRLCLLLERASASTSELKEVLDVAAQEATRSEAARARKRQGMMSYVVVVYVVFAVFLYVVYMITNLLYGPDGFAAVASGPGGAPGVAKGIAPEAARMLFFQAVLIQGACCGIVAGRLGEGYVLSGLKHVCILVTIAWLTFATGVF